MGGVVGLPPLAGEMSEGQRGPLPPKQPRPTPNASHPPPPPHKSPPTHHPNSQKPHYSKTAKPGTPPRTTSHSAPIVNRPGFVMLRPIQLNSQPQLRTSKNPQKINHRILTPKPKTTQSPPPQMRPEHPFRIRSARCRFNLFPERIPRSYGFSLAGEMFEEQEGKVPLSLSEGGARERSDSGGCPR